MLAEDPSLRARAQEAAALVERVVADVNELGLDDTIGSEDKPLLPEAFDQVKEGLDWAGVEYDEVLYKSDRIPLHYEWAEKLLATGEAYVCECDAETLRKNREAMRACVHRI